MTNVGRGCLSFGERMFTSGSQDIGLGEMGGGGKKRERDHLACAPTPCIIHSVCTGYGNNRHSTVGYMTPKGVGQTSGTK